MEKFDFDLQANNKEEEESALNYQLIVAVVLLVLLIGGGIYWFVNRGNNDETSDEVLNEQEQEATESSEKVVDSTAFGQEETTNMANDSINNDTNTQETEETTPVEKVNSNTPDTVNDTQTTKTADLKFFIVKGAFKNENNAQNTLSQLKTNGYQAVIVGPTSSGLYIVAYEGYMTIDEAKSKLQEIKQNNPQAWIYKKID